MSARAQPIPARAIAPFVNVKSVFLIWLETSDCPRDQNRIAQLFEVTVPVTELPMVGRRTPTAGGSDAGVAQALNARIERQKRYLIQGSPTKSVGFR